jgi:hypothetical protein
MNGSLPLAALGLSQPDSVKALKRGIDPDCATLLFLGRNQRFANFIGVDWNEIHAARCFAGLTGTKGSVHGVLIIQNPPRRA